MTRIANGRVVRAVRQRLSVMARFTLGKLFVGSLAMMIAGGVVLLAHLGQQSNLPSDPTPVTTSASNTRPAARNAAVKGAAVVAPQTTPVSAAAPTSSGKPAVQTTPRAVHQQAAGSNPPAVPAPNEPTPYTGGLYPDPPADFRIIGPEVISVPLAGESSPYTYRTSDGSSVIWSQYMGNIIWADGTSLYPWGKVGYKVISPKKGKAAPSLTFTVYTLPGLQLDPQGITIGVTVEDGTRDIVAGIETKLVILP